MQSKALADEFSYVHMYAYENKIWRCRKEIRLHVMVTGANGYLGRRLVARLIESGTIGGDRVSRVTLTDLWFDEPADGVLSRHMPGDLTQQAHIEALGDAGPDIVFHLACIASGATEKNVPLATRLNLDASLALFERFARSHRAPRLVFTSSIAVLGQMRAALIDDDTPIRPSYSYGAQKLAAEIILADYTRRGVLHGRTVRLPGIVVRPALPNGALSAFSSDLMRAAAQGTRYVCPVSPAATTWLMSIDRCLDNLLHAPFAEPTGSDAVTSWTLPALHVSVQDIVDALARRFGPGVHELVTFEPVAQVERDFGRMPPLEARLAEMAGFRGDGTIDDLMERALPEVAKADEVAVDQI